MKLRMPVAAKLRIMPALCLGAYALALGVAWRRHLTGDRSPYQLDIEFYHHPATRELVLAWSQGRIPLWTDRIYCGFPFFADPQTAAWYPATWLVAGFGPDHGTVAFLLLHAFLAAAGGLVLLRAHGAAWPAAWAAGAMIPLSGFYAYEQQHPGLFAILCWVPLWLAACRRALRRPGAGAVALAALPLTAMIFAGTLQVLFGVALLFAAYLVGIALELRSEQGSLRAVRGLAAVLGAQGLGLALAGVVWVPAVAHFPDTARALGMTYAFASSGSLPAMHLVSLFARGAEATLGGSGPLDFEGASLYVGALALPLLLLGAASAPRTLVIPLASGLAVLALLASGRHGALHPLLFEWMPGAVGSLRGAGRAVGPLVVGIALLAGLGLHAARDPRRRRLLVGLLLACLLADVLLGMAAHIPLQGARLGSLAVQVAALALCLVCARRPDALVWGLAALVGVDGVAFGALREGMDRSPPPPLERQLAGALRFPALADIAAGRFGPDPEGGLRRVALLGGFGGDNFTFLHGLDGVGGYNPLVTLQYLDWVHRVDAGSAWPRRPISQFVHDEVPTRVGRGLFEAASVRFLISPATIDAPGWELRQRYAHPVTRQTVWLYEQRDPLPRAYLSYVAQRAADMDSLDRLLGEDFDPRRATVFEGEGPELAGPPGTTPVRAEHPRPERLRFAVMPERDALLVVSDSWHPGWRAWVDGRPTPVLRVNGQFRGIRLTADARQVELRFEPRSFRVGAALSSLGAAGLAGLCLAAIFRHREARI